MLFAAQRSAQLRASAFMFICFFFVLINLIFTNNYIN